jgi:hypothetical protein
MHIMSTVSPMASDKIDSSGEHALRIIIEQMIQLIGVLRDDGSPAQVWGAFDQFRNALSGIAPGVDPDELHSQIMRLSLDLAHTRRREIELQRLLRIARELMATADERHLLTVIVEAAGELVRSDVAHLNLYDEQGAVDSLRASTGARTEAFRQQRTPAGAGLTGLVMRTRSTYVTHDYLADPAIEHNSSADASITADGLVTMAAVPLLRGEAPLGVLMASWRSRVVVSDAQLDLLATLASFATMAVTTTRILASSDRVKQALESANAQLEWSAGAHDRLHNLLRPGADLVSVVETLRELLDVPVAIFEPDGAILAVAPTEFPGQLPGQVELARASGRMTVSRSTGNPALWISPAYAGDDLLGVLVVKKAELNEAEQRTVERAATTSALILSTQQAVTRAQFQSAAEVVSDVVRGVHSESARERLRDIGLEPTAAMSVLVVETPPDARRRALAIARQQSVDNGGATAELDGRIVSLLPSVDPDRSARQLFDRLRSADLLTVVGGAGPCPVPSQISEYYRQAISCCAAQQSLVGTGVATPTTLGFVGLLLGGASRPEITSYVDARLGALERYDAQYGTDLIVTVEAYLSHDRSLRLTASALQIHPNTVLQRLKRAESLADIDLHSASTGVEVYLALKVKRLLATAGGLPT